MIDKLEPSGVVEHDDPYCDSVHGGDLACIKAAVDFIEICGCITMARKVIDAVEKTRKELESA